MRIPHLNILGPAVVLVAAVAIGFVATGVFQRNVAVAPGIGGCVRLEGSARQVDCLTRELSDGAQAESAGKTGADREDAVIGFVERAELLAADDSRIANLCHPAMHQLGRDEGSRAADADQVPRFPNGTSQLCTAGYVHGLSEGYLVGTPTADVAQVFPKLCSDPKAVEGCAHGIGHALLQAQKTGDVVDDATPAALARCGGLPGVVRPDCVDGIYMELAMRPKPAQVQVDDYVRACTSTPDVERELSCWGYLGLSLTANDIATSEEPGWCAKASLPGQYTCIEGYGRDIGAKHVSKCADASKDLGVRKRCVDGAIGLQVGSGHISAQAARAECTKIDDAPVATYCTNAVKRYLKGRAALVPA